MKTKLQQYFPMIQTKEFIEEEIKSNTRLMGLWKSWTKERQQEFLDFCTGNRGVKILYDSFFKEIFDPYIAPERLNDFLSILLRQRVRVVQILPTDSRIGNETSLLSLDIVVQLEDGTLVNVEVQKVGYLFPGERSACYSADLLLRQYHRVKSELRKHFSYRDVKGVYTIVFFEKSPQIFKDYPDIYIHTFQQTSDSGLEMELLQKYMFVPLDIFKNKLHNDGVTCKLDAWLAFLCCDSPDDIVKIITKYPEFMPLYEHIYEICLNVEKVMGMFSKELALLDKNTELYMIDEMQKEIAQLEEKRNQMESERNQMKSKYAQMESERNRMKSECDQMRLENQQLKSDIQRINAQMENLMRTVEQLTQSMEK